MDRSRRERGRLGGDSGVVSTVSAFILVFPPVATVPVDWIDLYYDLFPLPDLLPFDMDVAGGRVRTVRLTEADYREESFLDERLLAVDRGETWVSIEDIDRAAPAGDPRLNYIFHLGHVGSTLLSRVLGASESVFSVREPLILRRLAAFDFQLGTSFCPWPMPFFEARLDTVLKLLARVYRSPQVSLVKVTSFVGEMGSRLMSRTPRARAILLIVRPQVYIATILAGAASRAELAEVSTARLARLRRRFPLDVWEARDLSEGELAAVGWTCELLGLAEVARASPDRSLWVDFDDFLLEPRGGLESILVHLGGDASAAQLDILLDNPDFGRYSKATEHLYDSSVRRRLIGDASATHAVEIERGLAWINRVAVRHPSIARAARTAAMAVRR